MIHDLLIAKICVYGFSIDVAALFYLYLKRRKQNVRIIYTHSAFAILLPGVPKVQHLGHFYSTTVLINFAHDKIYQGSWMYYRETYYFHFRTRQSSCYWLVQNKWNDGKPDKFQTIFVKKSCRIKDSYALNISNQTINPENCIKLLGIEIDNTLSFEQKNLNLYKKASYQMR